MNGITVEEAEALIEQYGGIKAAARATGHAFGTLQRRHAKYVADKGLPVAPESEIEYPDLPSSELPPEKLIDQACDRFSTRLQAREARRWFEIKVNQRQPIGLCFVGDPHIDNSGTNWPLLRDHIRILEDTPGMYAIGGNDITDNWVGRLIRLYDDAEMTKKQAWKLAKYLLRETRIKWLAHVLGNHDQWNDGPTIIKANAQVIVPVEEWQARFQLVFPTGARVRIHMAHDFPGHSQWNQLHGAQKQAMWGERADIYAAAHKHEWAMFQSEHPHRGYSYWMVRSRGYKFIDRYAEDLGFGSQRHGASVTAIIDPSAEGPNRVQCFADVGDAAQFLTWKRSREVRLKAA